MRVRLSALDPAKRRAEKAKFEKDSLGIFWTRDVFEAGTFIRDIRDVGTSRIFRMFRMSRITRKIPVHRKCCEIAAHMRFPSAACARARPPELLCASLELCKHVHD